MATSVEDAIRLVRLNRPTTQAVRPASSLTRLADVTAAANSARLARLGVQAQNEDKGPNFKSLLNPLNAIQLPMRAIAATAEDAIRYQMGPEGDVGRDEAGSWLTRVLDPTYGYGRALDLNRDGTITGNKWGDRAIGLAGDVLFDPTTYVTLGAGQFASRAGRSALAETLRLAGAPEQAIQKAGKYGLSGFRDAERVALNLSEILGRDARSGLRFMGARIPSTAGVADAVGTNLSKIRAGYNQSKIGSKIRDATVNRDLKEALTKLTTGRGPMSAGQASGFIGAYRRGSSEGTQAATELGQTALEVARSLDDDVRFNGAAAIENDDLSNPVVAGVKQWFDDARTTLNDRYGLNIPERQRYVPHIWTDDGRQILNGEDEIGADLRRILGITVDKVRGSQIVEGRQLVGGTHNIGGEVVDFGRGTIAEINDEMRRVFPNVVGTKDVLESDLVRILDFYVGFAGTAVREKAMLDRLVTTGAADLSVNQMEAVVDPKASRQAKLNEVLRTRRELRDAKGAAARSLREVNARMDVIAGRFDRRMSARIGEVGDKARKVLQGAGFDVKDLATRLRDPKRRTQAIAQLKSVVGKMEDRVKVLQKELDLKVGDAKIGRTAERVRAQRELGELQRVLADLKAVETQITDAMGAPPAGGLGADGVLRLTEDDYYIESQARQLYDDEAKLDAAIQEYQGALEAEQALADGWPKKADVDRYKLQERKRAQDELADHYAEAERKFEGFFAVTRREVRRKDGRVITVHQPKISLDTRRAAMGGGEYDTWRNLSASRKRQVAHYLSRGDTRDVGTGIDQIAANFDGDVEAAWQAIFDFVDQEVALQQARADINKGVSDAVTRRRMLDRGYYEVNGLRPAELTADQYEKMFVRTDEIIAAGGRDALPDIEILPKDAGGGEVPEALLQQRGALEERLARMVPPSEDGRLPFPQDRATELQARVDELSKPPMDADIKQLTVNVENIDTARRKVAELVDIAEQVRAASTAVATSRKEAVSNYERLKWAEAVMILVDPENAENRIALQKAARLLGDDHPVVTALAAAVGVDGAEKDATYALLSRYMDAEWELLQANAKVDDLAKSLEFLKRPDAVQVFTTQLKRGWTEISDRYGIAVPSEMAAMFERLPATSSEFQPFLKVWDTYINFFKTYATLSPRFHIRNLMGGLFNNMAHGVSPFAMTEGAGIWNRYMANPIQFASTASDVEKEVVRIVLATGGGQWDDIGRRMLGSKATQNAVTNRSARAGFYVEGWLRSGMALDTIQRRSGGLVTDSFDEAVARIELAHFIYADSNSQFNVFAKRFIPFWTFMSRNLPMQMQVMWTRPRAYNVYQSIMRNVDASDESTVTPIRLKDRGAALLPFGNNLYLAPDMGFNRLQEDVAKLTPEGWPRLMSETIAPLRLAIEGLAGKRLYNDQPFRDDRAVPVSGPKWALLPLLAALGGTTRTEDGQLAYTDFANYATESFIPTLGQLERLFPQEERNKQRRLMNALTFLTGAPAAQVSQADIENELFRRNNGFN